MFETQPENNSGLRNEAETVEGVIFNIQHYAIHDGPGIRTTVFLKGCPLQCLWCQNPESQKLVPELFLNSEQCTGCGTCAQVCTEGAIDIIGGKSRTSRVLCKVCGKCVEVCPNEARNLMGRRITASEVFQDVQLDSIFYERSGGGVTLSGGDPLAQLPFSIYILRLCKDAGIHTAVETCGYAKWNKIKQLLTWTDLVLYDFKHMDRVEHKRCTGVANDVILENARRIHHELSIPLIGRVPVIPGYNDSIENMKATARFIATELDRSIKVHLLPYHKMGEVKYERLEKQDHSFHIDPPTDEQMATLREIFESFGLTVMIGG